MELDDVLSDKEPEKVEVPAEAPPTVEAEKEAKRAKRKEHQEKEFAARAEGEGKVRDPVTGQFVPKEAPKEEPKVEVKPELKPEPKAEPKQEFTERERAFLKAAEEERRKRQELEKRIAESKPKEEPKAFWDDPEGHLKKFEENFEKRAVNIKLDTAEAIARSRHPDFDEKVAVFAELLQTSPGLHAQWMQSVDPAEFAYRTGKQTLEIREAGSLDDLRKKIEKETREKLEAEYKGKQEELEKQRAALPKSLSDVRGAAKQNQPVFTGPTPLESVLKG